MEIFNLKEWFNLLMPLLVVIVFGLVMTITRKRFIDKKSNLQKHLKAFYYILIAAGLALIVFYFMMPSTNPLAMFSYVDINDISDPEKLLEMLQESADVTLRLNSIIYSLLMLLFFVFIYMGGIIWSILKRDPNFQQQNS
jgi:hypothetical protein